MTLSLLGARTIELVGLTSIVKPLLCVVILFLWARWATIVDKDAMYYYQNRRMWNTIQVVSGALAFLLIFLMPIFYLGFPLGVFIIVFAATSYVLVRNREVPEEERWRFDKDFFIQMIQDRREQKELKKAVLQFTSPPPGLKTVPMPEDAEREPHIVFEQVIENALKRGAQKLHLTGNDQQFQAQITIDGVDYNQGTLDAVATMGMVDYLKAHAKMDVTNRRKKQIGDVKISHEEHGAHTLRVHTAGSTRGLTCTVEIDPAAQLTIEYKDLGFLEPQRRRLDAIIDEPGGVVLVACPPAHGRSTTLYSLVERHDPYTMDIHTLEPRVQRFMEGVKQTESRPDEVAKALHSMLLRDPQVVMLSELPDQEVAKRVATGAVDGPRIYVGINANSMFEAMALWSRSIDDPAIASKSLQAVISQRLVRRLCTTCRQQYAPDEAMLRKLNVGSQSVKVMYKSGGKVLVRNKPEPCPACGGLGYKGCVGVFEVMTLDDEGRGYMEADEGEQLRIHLRRQKVLWMQESGLAKVISGQTSMSELTRVFQTSKGQPDA